MKTFKTSLAIAVVGIMLINPAWGSDIGTINLRELIDEALTSNPELKAARQRWEAAKAAIPQARSLEDPVLSVMFDRIPDSSINPGASTERQYSITQGVPYPGKLSLMGKMAGNEAGMAYEEYRGKEKDIIRELKAAYFDYFVNQKSIETNLETKEILHHMSKTAEAKYATGLVSQWDVLRASIELSQVTNDIIILKQQKESILARINRLLSRPVESGLDIPASPHIHRDLPAAELLEEIAFREKPELKGMELAIEREVAGRELAKKGYYPDFMVRLAQREEDRSAAGWIAEFGVRVPLWFRSKQDNKVRESVNRVSAAKEVYQSVKNMAIFEIKDARVKLATARSLMELYQSTNIPQAEQALKGAMITYETGKVDFFALMESWRTLKAYKLDYFKAVAAFEQSWADLERAVGKELP